MTHLAFIGFGEAAGAFVSGWQSAGLMPEKITTYDRKTDAPTLADAKRADYAVAGVIGADSVAQAVAGAVAVFSAVTADQAISAARAAARHLAPGALWLDCNSCSPGAKRQSAALIEAAGAAYVDVAVMAPVYPKRHLVPLLIAGPHVAAAQALFAGLGMTARIAGDDVGRASAIKMIRSIMVKGMEALSAECVLAGVRAGVAEEVIASLQASAPGINWISQTDYNLERMQVHGPRRAAEMDEVAKTVAELGLPPGMASATRDWQALIGGLGMAGDEESTDFARARAILARLAG